MKPSLRVILIHVALVICWFPAAVFWRFAEWQSRLRTKLDNERGQP